MIMVNLRENRSRLRLSDAVKAAEEEGQTVAICRQRQPVTPRSPQD